ncbi:MAG: hypothetical protein DDT33_01536 [Firmicutes bacterium]|nr:hypothetical protein [Bacillota bacterium]
MLSVFQMKNIVIPGFSWYFFDGFKNIFQVWKNLLLFNLEYFSVLLLLKTFFSPWRRYQWSYGRGFDFKRYSEVIISNLISRIMGAIMRTFLILIGIISEILIIAAGVIILTGWLILPIFLLAGFIFGILLIFS